MTTADLLDYYSSLLVIQYANKTKAVATVQAVVAGPVMDMLPNAVQDGFNLLGSNIAVGVQLDVLGKYAGVTRSGFGPTGPITLDDADFLKLIQMAIITNSNPSDLSTITNFLYQYFPDEIQVFDDANTAPMQMTYFISSDIGSSGLLDLFISENLLPRPMAVGIAVIVPPSTNQLYGWCDYTNATPSSPNTVNTVGMNCAASYTSGAYHLDWPYMDYRYSIM